MPTFTGFADGKTRLTKIPEAFFSDLLSQIKYLEELKVVLYFFWRLGQMEGTFRHLHRQDLIQDAHFMEGLGKSSEEATIILDRALTRLGRTAEVREALEVAYKFASNNLEVLRRVAACRDVYGDRAATVYEELARKLESENGSRAELIQVLERGLIVAMRDGEIEAAQRISISLRSYSRDPGPPSPSSGNPPSPALVKIPGGTKALARMAGMHESLTPGTFLARYAERLVRLREIAYNSFTAQKTFEGLKEYFETFREIQSALRPSAAGTTVATVGSDEPQTGAPSTGAGLALASTGTTERTTCSVSFNHMISFKTDVLPTHDIEDESDRRSGDDGGADLLHE